MVCQVWQGVAGYPAAHQSSSAARPGAHPGECVVCVRARGVSLGRDFRFYNLYLKDEIIK